MHKKRTEAQMFRDVLEVLNDQKNNGNKKLAQSKLLLKTNNPYPKFKEIIKFLIKKGYVTRNTKFESRGKYHEKNEYEITSEGVTAYCELNNILNRLECLIGDIEH